MGRLLAIDYGTKRCGIASSDPLQIIASGLCTVDRKELLPFLTDYFKKETVDELIIGEPLHMDNRPMAVEADIQKFIEQLQKLQPTLVIKRFDERFSSKMAFQTMIDSGLKKKARRNKALIDEISATIILQSYMQSLPS